MTEPSRPQTRDLVLTQIRTATTPPTVDEIASALALHPNSVRLHAGALEEAALVTRGTRPTGGRGRPLTVYRPTPKGARAGGRNYEILAEVLVDHIAATEPEPELAARAAGRAWGERLAHARRGGTAHVVPAVLTELGFEPDGDLTTIELRNCPFRELVDTHQGLVCSLHAGMLDGLAGDDGRVTLAPFTGPETCTVSLATT